MASSPTLPFLLAPPDTAVAEDGTTTLLDSHFQSVNELQLDDLLAQARQRHEQLDANLLVSHKQVESLLADTRNKATLHLEAAQELSLLRHSLVDELTELSQELVSNLSFEEKRSTLLEDLETLHRNLKELTSIRSYAQIIEYALSLSESARRQLEASASSLSPASVSVYHELQKFVSKVSALGSSCEDSGPEQHSLHLISFLENLEIKTWTDMKAVLSNILLASSEKIGWPMPVNYIGVSLEDRNTFEKAFHNLLKFQSLGEKLQIKSSEMEKNGLYPLRALVQPLSLRFKYHFEGTRQTNRTDKPEWYFTHVQNIVHDHRPFMESVVQNLLSSTDYSNIDAWREFVFLLLPMLSRKLRHTIPSLLPHPPLLAHTIYQSLLFDASLREQGFQLHGTSSQKGNADSSKPWAGISEVVLGSSNWFESWLAGENKFAEDQYQTIISSPDAWTIVDDSDEDPSAQDFKPTTSARRIKALIEQITDRYAPLPHCTQRVRFLVTIQLPILNLYYGRISSSLDAYETLSSAFVRAVPGALSVNFGAKTETGGNIDTHRLTGGVEGVQRLCKAFLAATFVEAALEGWGEDLFFLDLWTEINTNQTLREQAEKSSLLPPLTVEKGEALANTIFDELISRYTQVIVRAEDMMIQQIYGEVESSLKAHFHTMDSTESIVVEQPDDVSLSQSLLAPIALLSSHLTFIRSSLPQNAVINLYRRIASRLAEHILHRQVLYRGQFNLRQGRLITAECELWAETCRATLAGRLGGARYRVETPWLRLLQAGRLVGLDGDEWRMVKNASLEDVTGEDWSKLMARVVGVSELNREEVDKVLRRRRDF
ncbi:hypothetical protein AX17_000321 [Amanita inopinata Kibby_2008]|nr:hypothetical protein AX17_000321 [Amanita inopinata Kibby_2008]